MTRRVDTGDIHHLPARSRSFASAKAGGDTRDTEIKKIQSETSVKVLPASVPLWVKSPANGAFPRRRKMIHRRNGGDDEGRGGADP